MKKLSLLAVILLVASGFKLFAQDVIYKTDGSKEEAKVVFIGDDEVQYKKFKNLDGPVYIIDKDKIVLITYENGDYDMFQDEPAHKAMAHTGISEDYTKNILNYHVLDVFYGDVTLSYERIIAKGIVGIHIPAGFGYAYNFDYFDANENWVKNLFFSGVGVNFYPGGQGKWRYFVGPKVLIGYGKQTYWGYVYDENGNWLYDEEYDNEGVYTKYMVDNGIRFTPVKNFSIAAILSVGIRYFPDADYYSNVVMPTGHFGMNISYRF